MSCGKPAELRHDRTSPRTAIMALSYDSQRRDVGSSYDSQRRDVGSSYDSHMTAIWFHGVLLWTRCRSSERNTQSDAKQRQHRQPKEVQAVWHSVPQAADPTGHPVAERR